MDSGLMNSVNTDFSRVDPFNYPGQVHFGPAYTIIGPHPPRLPPGSGFFEPRTGALMVPDFETDF